MSVELAQPKGWTRLLTRDPEFIAVAARPIFLLLVVLTVSNALGFQAWRTLLNNFMVESAHLNGAQNGIVQSVREVPGFLALLVVYVLLVVREFRLAALSILALGVGIALTGVFPSFVGITLTTLLMSFGFHYFETTQQSLTLQHFEKDVTPWVMGKQRSFQAVANVLSGAAIFLLTPLLAYRELFLLFGLPVALIGLWALKQNPVMPKGAPQAKRMVLRKRYSLFYALTFMAGARRQVFVAFAVFLSVERFGFTLQEITALFVVNNMLTYYLGPKIGKAIIRFGERPVLIAEYASLFFIFLGYAFAASKWQIIALYLLDHLFFSFKIALSTYFQKIAHPSDIAPTVAVAFTINHIAAVAIPAGFGALWLLDYRLPFLLGAGLTLVSLSLATQVRIPALDGGAAERLPGTASPGTVGLEAVALKAVPIKESA